jgi:hypothetical protein
MLRQPQDYLSVSFLQIGTDAAAKRFLDELDCDYKGHQNDDFVDTIYWLSVITGVGGVSLEHLIAVCIVNSTLLTPLQALRHTAMRCGFS